MERPESATKVPEAGRRISPARYCTTTRRPRKAEYRAILYSVSETSSNRVNSTKGPPPKNCGKTVVRMWKKSLKNAHLRKTAQERASWPIVGSAPGKFCGAVAGFFQRVGLQVGPGLRVALQISIPEGKRGRIRVIENRAALLRAAGKKRARRDEGHVIGAFDVQVIFVPGLAALEGSLVPCRARDWAQAVERACHSHVRQSNSIEGMIVQPELARPLRRKA